MSLLSGPVYPERLRRSFVLGVMVLSVPAAPLVAGSGQPTVLAWNNLGMHCMDDDYSVFSILPPFNTVDAQLLDASGRLVTTAGPYTLTYEPYADGTGSRNSTSTGKTNFWTYAPALFGTTLPLDQGLAGFAMPGAASTPRAFGFDTTQQWFEATGVPLAPWDDAGRYNAYPVMRVTARDATQAVVAQALVVLPVSEEMDCRKCHGSDAGPAARPAAGWVADPVPKRDFRLNILRLHDERNLGQPAYQQALATQGYSARGLYDHVVNTSRPILCASCHGSEALPGSGLAGVSPLTRAMHGRHTAVLAPDTGLRLDQSTNRSACYQCHPGSATRCLRGAMGSAVAADGTTAIQCQACHGGMAQVASPARTGWLDEPNCQACHTGTATSNSGQIRYLTALNADATLRRPADTTFATTANTPASGKSLYRFSKGHGGVACAACHGSTHAEYPGLHPNDNLASIGAQGHVGTVADCTACHATMPRTSNGGPHGMHPVGQSWVSSHGDAAGSGGCTACHGADSRGTVLSRALGDRQLTTGFGSRTFWRGQQIGCYECHNGPRSESSTAVAAPGVPATLDLGSTPPAVAVVRAVAVSPAGGTTLRIVRQPEHGTVAVSGSQVTYRPDAGYVGADTFTYAAGNGSRESNLGAATVGVDLGDPAATPAGDGVSNLMKYVLGFDPRVAATAAQMPLVKRETFGTGQFLTLTAVLNPLAADTPVRVEASSDRVNWTILSDPALVLNQQPWLLKVRDNVDVAAGAPRYLRLAAGTAPATPPSDGGGNTGNPPPAGGNPGGRLLNLSTRDLVRGGNALTISGFVIGGTGTKTVLLRAVGPRLADFGVSGVLADPAVQLVRMNGDGTSTVVQTNDNWTASPDAALLSSVAQQVGAFPLNGGAGAVNDSRSAACLATLGPGSYTALVTGSGGAEGVALVELYDADTAPAPTARLINLSTRGYVGSGSAVMIGGLVVGGTQPRSFLVRGVGPKLAQYGVDGTLTDPRIEIVHSVAGATTTVARNENWGDGPDPAGLARTAAAVGAFPLDAGSKDAALVVTLDPGIYTALVSGADGGAGVALIEVYELP